MTPTPSTAPDTPRKHGGGILLALVPWVLFSLLVAHSTVEEALHTSQANLLFNWAIPVGLVVWAVKRTGAVADAPRAVTPVSL